MSDFNNVAALKGRTTIIGEDLQPMQSTGPKEFQSLISGVPLKSDPTRFCVAGMGKSALAHVLKQMQGTERIGDLATSQKGQFNLEQLFKGKTTIIGDDLQSMQKDSSTGPKEFQNLISGEDLSGQVKLKITCIQGPARSGKTTRLRYLTYGKNVSFEPCGESWVQHREGSVVAFADVNSERGLDVVKSKLEQLKAGKVDVFNSTPVVLADKVEEVFVEGAADFSSLIDGEADGVTVITCGGWCGPE